MAADLRFATPRFPPVLWKVAWGYLRRHSWQAVLMVIGVALGVAVVVSIDIANASASRAFHLSTETLTGRATHQISAGSLGMDDQVYLRLRQSGLVQAAAPVVSAIVSSPQLGGQPLQLLGVDPLAEAPFRGFFGASPAPSSSLLVDFLTRPGAALISAENARRYHLNLGSSLTFNMGGKIREGFVAGLLEPQDDLSRRTLDGLILVDIATAQELTGRIGRLDRIDLILPTNDPGRVARIRARLPGGVELASTAENNSTLSQLSDAFQVNLTALSLLALVVGLFLIYNTMTFSVVQRRQLFGTLRCLGVTRGEIFTLVLGEAGLVAVIGSLAGLGLGILLGQVTVRLVLQTINDLYFTTTVRDVGLPLSSLVKGGLLGVGAVLLATVPPAWEAALVSPRLALLRSTLESRARGSVKAITITGILAALLGAGVFALPTRSLVAGFSGTLALVVAFALLAVGGLLGLMRLLTPLTAGVFGVLGRMAPRNVTSALSRTGVAVAALMVAVAVTVGVSLMIASFRGTVITWLEQSLQGDVYISAPSFTATAAAIEIDPARVEALRRWRGVARLDLLRVARVESPLGPVQVSATDNPSIASERIFRSLRGRVDDIYPALKAGAVLISEPLANRLQIGDRGGAVYLNTPQGEKSFPVAGVYYDYSSSQGIVLMSLDVYRRLWSDPAITAISLRLAKGSDPDQVSRQIQDAFASGQQIVVQPNQALRREVLVVFDRTFAITGALQILTILVAFVGLLNSLLLLQLDKQRELGILRAIGLTVRQLWELVLLETGLMGLAAGLFAMPTGYVLALILIYIINQRSFGWTLRMELGPGPFLQALAIALLAALLAGLYPARRLGRMAAADAMRSE
ncbi:MAG TPA: FtsX-like permease family protein [Anaerolineaceae bacterium]|nr:FtsX-like permease family protein [Anaerolineaceae bacterium]